MVKKLKINFEIKSLIAKKNITQNIVAEAIGMKVTTFNRKINGAFEFSESEIEKICSYFEKSPMEIFFTELVDNRTTKSH